MLRAFVSVLLLTSLLQGEAVDRTGPYLSLGMGHSTLEDDGRMQTQKIDTQNNYTLVGGAFINKYLSVEINLDYFETFTNSENSNETTIYIVDAAAKAHYSVWKDRIDFYGAFGAGSILWKETLNGVSQDDKAGVLRGDLGIGFRAVEWLTLNIGLRRYYFTLDHSYETKDSNDKPVYNYNRFHMTATSAYANLEVQF